jgi:hypothetical protein
VIESATLPLAGLDLGTLLQSGQCVAPGSEPTTNSVELGLFFLVGLFGTGHCLGMCGPLVSIYSDRMEADGGTATAGRNDLLSWPQIRQHLLFNFGRVTVYTLLGGFFGLLGLAMFATTDVAIPFGDEVRATTGVLVGAAIVVAGGGYLLGGAGGPLSGDLPVFGALFRRVHDALAARIDSWVNGPRIFALGFLHGFLPCPLLYPAFLYAFGQADPVRGALSLATLGAGTFPALFLYGTIFQSASMRHRKLVHRALGLVFLALGAHTLLMGLRLFGFDVPNLFSLPFYQPLR